MVDPLTIGVIVVGALTAASYYQQRKMQREAEKQANEMASHQISGHDSNRALYTVYGRALVGTTTIYKRVSRKTVPMSNANFVNYKGGGGTPDTSTKLYGLNRYLYRISSLCNGPIDGIEKVLIDGESHLASRFTAGHSKHFEAAVSLGPTVGNYFANLKNTYSTDFSQWDSSKKGQGVAYVVERFWFDKSKPAYQGEPQTQYLVRGRKLYDPRLDSTVTGGSGSHRSDTPSTWAFSDNPALALLDMLTNTEYGRGVDYAECDLPSFIAAANKCDTLVDIPARATNQTGSTMVVYDPHTGTTYEIPDNGTITNYRMDQVTTGTNANKQKRFRLNMAVDNSKEVLDNIQQILQSFRANLHHINGEYVVHMDDVASPVITLTDDDIIGGLKISQGDRKQRINRMTAKFLNANKHFKTDQVSWPPLDDTAGSQYQTYLTADSGEKLHKTVTLTGCTDYYQAEDIAEYLVRESRVTLTASGTFGSRCFNLVPGDVVALDYDSAGYSGKYFIVDQVGVDISSMNVKLNLREYDSSIYTWNANRGNEPVGLFFDEEQQYNATPTSMTIGTVSSAVITLSDGSAQVSLVVPFSNVPEEATSIEVGWAIANSDEYNTQIIQDETADKAKFQLGIDNQDIDIRVRYLVTNADGLTLPSSYTTTTFTLPAVSGTRLDGMEDNATNNEGELADLDRDDVLHEIPSQGLAHYWPCNSVADVDGDGDEELQEVVAGKTGIHYGTTAPTLTTNSPTGKATSVGEENGFILLSDADADALEHTFTAGSFVSGTSYVIKQVGTTDFTAIGASANTVGTTFTATGAGTGTGIARVSNNAGFAWSMWFKSTSSSGNTEGRLINRDPSDSWAILINQSSGSQNITFYGEPGTESVATISTDEWHHIAFSEDGDGTISIYFDGEFVSTEAYTPVVSNVPVAIGSDIENGTIRFAGDYEFVGHISEIRAYNRALTAQEVRGLYKVPAASSPAEIDGDMIIDGSLVAEKITVTTLDELTTNAGDIDGGSVGGTTITGTKLYQGDGNWANSDTGFYLDNTGKFSLKDKLFFSPTDSRLTVAGNVTADTITVNDQLEVFGPLQASALADGTITRDHFSQDAIDFIFGQLAPSVGGSNGDYKEASGNFTGSGGTVTVGSTSDKFDHGTLSVDVEFLCNHYFYITSDPSATDRQVTLNFEVSADGTFTDLTSATKTHTLEFNEYDLSGYYGYTYFVVYFNGEVTKTFTTGTGNDLADGTDVIFRVRVTGVGSAFSGQTVPFTVEANEGLEGVVSTGGNADFLDNLDSTRFLRSDEDDTFDGDLTITGQLILQGSIDQYNVTDLDVTDKTITVNSGNTQSLSDGAGLIVDRGTAADASFTWNETDDIFELNYPAKITKSTQNAPVLHLYHNYDGGYRDTLLVETPNDRDVGITFKTGGGQYEMWIDSNGDDSLIFSPGDNTANIAMELYQNKNVDFGGSIDVAHGITFNANGYNISTDTDGNRDLFRFERNGALSWQVWHTTQQHLNFDPANSAYKLQYDGYDVWHRGDLSDATKGNYDTAYTYSQVGHLPLAGGTLTGELVLDKEGTATSTTTTYNSEALSFRASGWDTNNNIARTVTWRVRHEPTASNYPDHDLVFSEISDGSTHSKFVLHGRGTTGHVDPKAATFYGNVHVEAGTGTNAGSGDVTVAGDISATGTLSASGYNSSNWDTAYTYSQVGHLPLAGGTISGNVSFEEGDNLYFGTDNDFQIRHSGTTYLDNTSGNLHIRQLADDYDIKLECDNGSGGVKTYMTLDGSTETLKAQTKFQVLPGNNITNGFDYSASNTVSNQNHTMMRFDFNFSGTETHTTDNYKYGVYIDYDSSDSGGDTNHETRLFPLYIDARNNAGGTADRLDAAYLYARQSGSADMAHLRALYSYGYATNTGGTVANLYGSQSMATAQSSSTGSVTNVFGAHNTAQANASSGQTIDKLIGASNHAITNAGNTSDITTMIGSWNEVQLDSTSNAHTISNMYAVYALIDENDAGSDHTINNSYLFYGDYQGNLQDGSTYSGINVYGVYIPDDVENRFNGRVRAKEFDVGGVLVIDTNRTARLTGIKHDNTGDTVIDLDDNTYVKINNPDGTEAIKIGGGGSTDAMNTYKNDIHRFYKADGTTELAQFYQGTASFYSNSVDANNFYADGRFESGTGNTDGYWVGSNQIVEGDTRNLKNIGTISSGAITATGTSDFSKITVNDGDSSAPTYTFASDTDTGMYSDTSDALRFAVGGSAMLSITSAGIGTSGTVGGNQGFKVLTTTVIDSDRNVTNVKSVELESNTPTTTTNKLYNVAGSLYWSGAELSTGNTFTSIENGSGDSSGPSYTFTGDTDTGMYSDLADTLRFAVGGSAIVSIVGTGMGVTGTVGASTGFKLGLTQWMDSSLNLSSIGTISSGAITSTGTTSLYELTLTGDTDNLTFTEASGDWSILNAQQNNGLVIYDGTSGVDINYNGNAVASFGNSGTTFTQNITHTGTFETRKIRIDRHNETALVFEDSGGSDSVVHTLNDSQGNYNIMLNVNDAGQTISDGDGQAKILMSGHNQHGAVSLNAGPSVATAGTTANYSISIMADGTDNTIRVGNPNNNIGGDPGDLTKVFDNSGNAFAANYTSSGYVKAAATSTGGFYIGATEIIEGDTRNVKSIGTISSGSITSSDSITATNNITAGTTTGILSAKSLRLNNGEVSDTDFQYAYQMIVDANDSDSDVPSHGDNIGGYPFGVYFLGDNGYTTKTLGSGLVKLWHTGHFTKDHIDHFVGLQGGTQDLTAPDISVTGNLDVAQSIRHISDEDTGINFFADQVVIKTGGTERLNITNSDINIKNTQVFFNSTMGIGASTYAPIENGNDSERNWLNFHRASNASYVEITNRTPGGKVVLSGGLDGGGGEVQRLEIEGGSSTKSVKILASTDLDLSSTSNFKMGGLNVITSGRNIQNIGNVNIGGYYAMDGTTIIDTSKNLVNIGTISSGAITASGAHTFTANDVDFIVQDTTDSVTNYIWRDHSNDKLYLGTGNAVVDLRSVLKINNTERIDMSGNATLGDITAQDLTLLSTSGHTRFTLGSRSGDPTPSGDGSYDFRPGMRVSAFEPSDGSVDGDADLPLAWTGSLYLAGSQTYATASSDQVFTFSVNFSGGTRWFAKVKTNDAESGNYPYLAVNAGTEYALEYADAAPSNGENDSDAWHVIDITDDVVTGSNTLKVWLGGGQKTYVLAIYVYPSTGIMLPNEPYESVGYFHKGIGIGDSRIFDADANLSNVGTISSGNITSSGTVTANSVVVNGVERIESDGDVIANNLTVAGNFTMTTGGIDVNGNLTASNGYVKAGTSSANGFWVGSTQIVEGDTRNLKNIGTISAGAITSSGQITAKSAVLTDDGSGSPLLKISADDNVPWAIQLYREDLGGGPQVFASNTTTWAFQGHLDLRPTYEYKIDGTTVIDSDRNLTNIGTVSSGAIDASGNSSFDKIDIVNTNQTEMLRIRADDTISNTTFNALYIDHNSSGSQAHTGDFTHRSIFVDLDSSATGGDTSNEHRVRGIESNVRVTGDSDAVYGIFGYAEGQNSADTVSEVVGVYGQAVADEHTAGRVTIAYALRGIAYGYGQGTGGTTTFYGTHSKVHLTTAQDKNSASVYGGFFDVETDDPGQAQTTGNLYGVRTTWDDDSGGNVTANNAYLFYGNYEGTNNVSGGKYGVYIASDCENRFEGIVRTNSQFNVSGTTVVNSNREGIFTKIKHDNTLDVVIDLDDNTYTKINNPDGDLAISIGGGGSTDAMNRYINDLHRFRKADDTTELALFMDGSITFYEPVSADVIYSDEITLSNGAPATTTNKLYNVGGSLYFNGSAVGGASSFAFDNLTGKTSGTGDYKTTGKFRSSGNIRSGEGSGGVAMTINDGYGNANLTFNHEDGVPEQNGNAARIEVNTDSSTAATMYFEVKSGVTNGTAVQTDAVFQADGSGIGIASGKTLRSVSGQLTIEATDTDFVVRDTTDSTQNFIWRDHSASKLYLGSTGADVELRADLSLQSGKNITLSGTITSGAISTASTITAGSGSSSLGYYVGTYQIVEGSTRNLKNINTINCSNVTASGTITSQGNTVLTTNDYDTQVCHLKSNVNAAINQGSANEFTVNFNLAEHVDSSTFSHSSGVVTVATAGWYRVYANMVYANASSSARNTVRAYVEKNGSEIVSTRTYDYDRGASYGKYSNNKIETMLYLAANDTVSIGNYAYNEDGVCTIEAAECEFIVSAVAAQTTVGNATTLGGQTAGAYLRSNQSDSASGAINFNGGIGVGGVKVGGKDLRVYNDSEFLGDIYVDGSAVLTSARAFKSVDAQGGTGGMRFQENVWFFDSSNAARLQFHGDNTYLQTGSSGGKHIFRNSSGSERFEIDASGNAIADGNITAYGAASDIRLKERIQRIEQPIEKVKKLDGVTFHYKKDGSRSTGLIAQQLLEVLPEVVYETSDLESDEQHYAVRYGQVVGLLVESIKAQQEQIEELQQTIEEMKNGNH